MNNNVIAEELPSEEVQNGPVFSQLITLRKFHFLFNSLKTETSVQYNREFLDSELEKGE